MEKIKREKLFMKIICISLSVILWFYVSYFENPSMTKTVRNVSVSISEEQLERLNSKGLSVLSVSEESVDVKVTARRLTLATLSNETLSAYINVSSISKSGTYYLPAIVVSEKSSEASYYVKGSDIKIVIEPIVSETFEIEANIDTTYVAYDTHELSTDSVTVYAPESVFKNIATIKTEYISIEEDTESTEVGLIIYDKEGKIIDDKNVFCDQETVDVKFHFFQEKTVPIKVKSDDGKVFTLPSEYDVKIYGTQDTLDSITSVETLSLNLDLYENGTQVKIKLDLPEGVKVSDEDREVEIELNSKYFK